MSNDTPADAYRAAHPATDVGPPADAPVESRSSQKRKAIMRGEEMPTFAAGPPVTSDGDGDGDGDADEIARIFVRGWVPGFNGETKERMISQLASQLRGAHAEGLAAGIARGRALGATDAIDKAHEWVRTVASGEEADECREFIIFGEARRAGRET